jgi:polar amino acid transport system permease protein
MATPHLLLKPQRGQGGGPSDWDWSFAREILPDLLEGLWITVQIALLGVGLALVGGLVFAILRRSRNRLIAWPVALIVEFVRSTPLLVQLYFLFFVLPPTFNIVLEPFTAAVIGLAIHYAAYTSESYRAGIESVPRGQWEAARALNLSRRETWRSVVLPQAIPTVIPALGNYVVASFKDAPLASAITVPCLLGVAIKIQNTSFRGLEAFTLAGLMFLAVSIPAAFSVRYLEKRFEYERA